MMFPDIVCFVELIINFIYFAPQFFTDSNDSGQDSFGIKIGA